jgi:DNA polymerase I-like protein with 3'-5' exonuclease and polymerase domains
MIPQNLSTIAEKLSGLRPEPDGSFVGDCPVCELEGKGAGKLRVYANGSLACFRFSGSGDSAQHRADILKALDLGDDERPTAFITESLFGGKLKIECSPAERGRVKVVARNCDSTLHRDTLTLDKADERAKFVKSLVGFGDDERRLIHQAMLKLADRFESVQAAIEEESEDEEVRQVGFAALPDGRLIDQVQGGQFAVLDHDRSIRYAKAVTCDGITYRPKPDFAGLNLPERLEEYGSDRELDEALRGYIRRYVDMPERELRLAAAYVRLSYLQDKYYEIPYARPTGPGGNGKSRFLRAVMGICYRSYVTNAPTASVIFRLIDEYFPVTLGLDEFNYEFSSNDVEDIMKVLNAGITFDGTVPRSAVEGDDWTPKSFRVFGCKGIASLKVSDSAQFESRCLPFQMSETLREDIPLLITDRFIGDQQRMRNMLSLWRLRNWRMPLSEMLSGAEADMKRHPLRISPRHIQLGAPLYALLPDSDLKRQFIDLLVGRTEDALETRKETLDGQIAAIVHALLFDVSDEGVAAWREARGLSLPDEGQVCEVATVERVTEEVNSKLPEKKQHDAKWIGRQVRKLGFTTREVKRRASPVYRKAAVVLERMSFARVFGLFSLPLPPEFDPPKPPSGVSGNDGNGMRGRIKDFPETAQEFDPPTQTADAEEVAGVGGLGGSKLPETGGEWFEKPSSAHSEAVPVTSEAGEFVALDTETEAFDRKRGVTPRTARMIGLALSYDGEEATSYTTEAEGWPLLMPEAEQTVIFHNAKFDLGVLARTGLPQPEKWEDTLIAAHLLDECGKHGLKPLAQEHLGVDDPLTFEEADRMRLLDPEVFSEYARNDARYTYRLWPKFKREMERQGLMKVYELEKSVVPVVLRMEARGMKLDLSQLGAMRREVEAETARIEAEIYEHARCKFDLRSPRKTAAILYDKIALPCLKTTRGGQRSVGKEALEELIEEHPHPVIESLLHYREVEKLASSFLKTLPDFADGQGRIHPEFKPLGARTGRFSCSDPNAQQVPSRSELGKRLRQAFIADDGNALVVADWSQMELRILAHYSQDPLLLEAYTSEHETDLHALTAARIFGKSVEAVEKSERTVAKTMNFGIIYGITPVGLFNRLRPDGVGATLEQCERFVSSYFATYGGVRNFLDKVRQAARERGYVRSLYGRRRRLKGGERGLSSREVRQAQNFVIQATAADLAKHAMVRLHAALPAGASLIATIHDEFIVECRAEQAEEVRALMVEVMQRTPDGFTVPMAVDAKIGARWGDCK